MHPLPVAQATAVSLHTLLPTRRATTSDEELVVEAIRGLHRWAISDKREVPVRLRRRRSVLLRMRIKSPDSLEHMPISKRRRYGNATSCHRTSANASLGRTVVSPSSRKQENTPLNDSDAGRVSRPTSSRNSSGQVANLSEVSTEPPEGWPKLSEISSPVMEVDPLNNESKEVRRHAKEFAGRQLASKQTSGVVVSTSPTTRREEINASNNSRVHKAPASPTKVLAKRQRVSSSSYRREEGSKACISTDDRAPSSQGSTRGTDPPSTSVDAREASRPLVKTQDTNGRKFLRSRRKNSIPRRRPPESTHTGAGPPLLNLSEKDEFDQATSFEDSPSPSVDNGPAVKTNSPVVMPCDSETESPTTPETLKSREQDVDRRSVEGHESAHSPGSVVIGSSSYDGCSIDMGKTNRTANDSPSCPSSIAWNASHEESIEEPSSHDQRAASGDAIRETEGFFHSEPTTPGDNPPKSKSTGKRKEAPTATENDLPEQSREEPDNLHQQTTSIVAPEGLEQNSHLNISNTTTGHALQSAGNANFPSRVNARTPSASDRVNQSYGRNNPDSILTNGISPVSQEDRHLREEICPKVEGQRNNSNILMGTNIDEMNVCIASFQKEIELELAQELVMRLGGEVVSDFNTALPHCVVAPIDVQTKEVTNSDMIVLLALASRIPVVGMSWLTHCFKSGSWVDFNDFETPSSKVKPNMGVFRGIAATFEDAFSRKNAERKCVEYRKGVEKLVKLGDGVVVDGSGITEIARKDKTLRLHIRIAYDFEDNTISSAPQDVPEFGIPMRVVSQAWISACLFSGQCPPP